MNNGVLKVEWKHSKTTATITNMQTGKSIQAKVKDISLLLDVLFERKSKSEQTL